MIELIKLRQKIDRLDQQILTSIARRMTVAVRIGRLKKTRSTPITILLREQDVLKNWQNIAEKEKLDSQFIFILFKLIIKESKRIQNEK